ncbi:SDR family oxidoreductase UcpA [Bifidobacterium choloepi]|uniref:SDR family oxidoreductase UcpA n=1 Tax=Bifidobacterium choloepi TaxID=2614131 RepID=A0A6I5N230_9BIFI|nr:SDR family oxidoreductase UcpA [Bifidobacterium choloepi]NEG70536.1 SDR family oxidoreductase UcpA [Bifidobacterium choloepi]
MTTLNNKVAVVTGASKGIGAGIARVFARQGASVVLAARGADVLDLAAELRAEGCEATGVQCDVTDPRDCKRLARTAVESYGRIDILDCNAGICRLGNFLDENDSWRDAHVNVNINGVWNACKSVIPEIVRAGGGAVVITSSVTGDLVADPGEAAYAMTKAALVGLTKALAREFADRNVRVNCICPGYIRTPLVEGMAEQSDPDNPERAIDEIARAVPLGRLGTPEECGQLCAFLASDDASYITGAQVVIDGGSTLPETTSMGQ